MNKELALRTLAYLKGQYKANGEIIINKEEIEAIDFILDDNEVKDKELDKYKKVIDNTKEKIELDLKDGRPKDHLWLMGYYDACKDINKLLEEVK